MKEQLENIIKRASHYGADACDLVINAGESLNLSAQGGKLEKYKLAKTSSLGIRVIKNNRIGLSYTESMDDDAVNFALKSSIENAQFADINLHETINIKNSSDLVFKSTHPADTSTIEEKIEFALKLESEVYKRDPRVKAVPYNGLSSSSSQSYYMNSLGTYTEDQDHYLSAYSSALIQDGPLSSMHYAPIMGRKLSKLDLNECIEESLLHSRNWLEAKPVATGKYDVLFNTEVLSEILHAFSSCFSAKDAIDKINPWEHNLGKKIAHEGLTLIDSPKFKDAFYKYNFDSEGVIKKDLTLIENGVLKTFYHNTATASFYKTISTGHATRGTRSSLNVSGSNLIITPGEMSDSDVQEGTYLEVIDVMGIGPGSDSISGEFSFGASGYLCKNGKRIQPVKGVTIAGNFNNLINEIGPIGKTLHHNHSQTTFSPLIKFLNLSVAGS